MTISRNNSKPKVTAKIGQCRYREVDLDIRYWSRTLACSPTLPTFQLAFSSFTEKRFHELSIVWSSLLFWKPQSGRVEIFPSLGSPLHHGRYDCWLFGLRLITMTIRNNTRDDVSLREIPGEHRSLTNARSVNIFYGSLSLFFNAHAHKKQKWL